MTIWKDGPNADRNGNDLSVETSKVGNKSTLSIQLAPGGGVAAMIEPAN